MEIPFVGGAYLGRSLNLNAQVCQNLYPVVDNEGGKKVLALMGVAGLIPWESALAEFNYVSLSGGVTPQVNYKRTKSGAMQLSLGDPGQYPQLPHVTGVKS